MLCCVKRGKIEKVPTAGKTPPMKGIRQLAKHLDISIGTVSRALNGKADVNAETRQRVLAAAVELGYVANQSGRSLRQGTAHSLPQQQSATAGDLGVRPAR